MRIGLPQSEATLKMQTVMARGRGEPSTISCRSALETIRPYQPTSGRPPRQSKCSRSIRSTLKGASSVVLQDPSFPPRSGPTCSRTHLSTSIKFSSQMQGKSIDMSEVVVTGSSRGLGTKRPSSSSSPIEMRNSRPMVPTSRTAFSPTRIHPIESSITIGEFGRGQQNRADFVYLTSPRSSPITPTSSLIPVRQGHQGPHAGLDRPRVGSGSARWTFAGGSISGHVATLQHAGSDTHVSSAGDAGTPSLPARTELAAVTEDRHSANKYPRFTRGFLWELATDSHCIMPSASASERAPPLPGPPSGILNDPDTIYTLSHFPHLFGIGTPMNVPRFASLTRTGLSSTPSFVGLRRVSGHRLTTIPGSTPPCATSPNGRSHPVRRCSAGGSAMRKSVSVVSRRRSLRFLTHTYLG